VSRFAVHQFPAPGAVLDEMARVCRVGGRVAVEDLFTSELPARAEYQNRFERLRDPSHTRALPLSELLGLFAARQLEVERVQTDVLLPSLERWLANAHTPPEAAAAVRRLVEADEH